MGIPDPALANYLISGAETRASELIAAFTDAQPTESAATFARMNAVLDDYCGVLLDALRRAVGAIDSSEATWLRKHYLRLIVEFATSLRDSIADQTTRHAAAQVIQCKVLEHERNLRIALESHGGLVSSTAAVAPLPDATEAAPAKVPATN
jgi:hypothetical protein